MFVDPLAEECKKEEKELAIYPQSPTCYEFAPILSKQGST
jgi:hypothetical protein